MLDYLIDARRNIRWVENRPNKLVIGNVFCAESFYVVSEAINIYTTARQATIDKTRSGEIRANSQ